MTDAEMPPRELTVLGGRYRLLRRLGHGGVAEVFLAEQVSLNRKVALKVIARRGAQQPEAEARFRREALLHSTIDHPAVVRVLDFETGGPEGTVVVLEYVEGRRLDELLAQGPLPLATASTLLLQLAEGLAAIHAKGVVHRDLKAENVMVAEGLKGPQARILDFGLARAFDPTEVGGGDGRSFVSGVGQLSGTPAYLAPEQLSGLPADPRSDVYSFGITAYLLLTGELPFPGPEVLDFIQQHAERRPPDVRARAPDVPAPLAELVAWCLEKNPAKRPANGAALAALVAKAVARSERPPPVETKRRGTTLLVAVSVAAALAPAVAVERPWEASSRARWWLRADRPARALETLNGAADRDALALRALALARLGKKAELGELVREHCVAIANGLDDAGRAQVAVGYDTCAALSR